MDSISGTGFLYVSAATSPSGQEGWLFQRQPTMAGSIETRKGKIQEFHPFNSSQVYTRTCNWDTEVWNPWLRIDNFGCNTASELANLLGVVSKCFSVPKTDTAHILTSSDDMNNIITPGIYDIKNADAPQHVPSWGGLNSLVLVYTFDIRVLQIMFEHNYNKIGFRRSDLGDNTWGNWYEIALISQQ